jgi:Uma2 family endonuclease
MADNTKQFDRIVKIKVNLDQIFADNPDIFVAGDLLWYPVEGSPKIRIASDAMVVFGRPKGHRGSYKMWEENNIAPQVVFEILSPGNTAKKMRKKLKFYEAYGVWEYYLYDPDNIRLEGWICKNNMLLPIENMQGWVSPILKIRFELREDDLEIFRPDGKKFLYPTDAERQHQTELLQERRKSEQAEKEAERQRADSERIRADVEWLRAEKLAAKLRELGIEADAI